MATSIRKASRTLWLRFAQFLTPTRRPVRAQTIRAAILGTFLAGVMVYAPEQSARLRLAESSQDCSPQGAKVDLAFIIDRSGSLDVKAQGQTYNVEIEGVRRAILDPSLIPRDASIAVAVFTFAGGPSLHVPFTEIKSEADAAALAAKVEALKCVSTETCPQKGPNPESNVGQALLEANKHLSNNQRAGARRVLLVSTDGGFTDEPFAETASIRIRQENRGIASEVDVILLGLLADPEASLDPCPPTDAAELDAAKTRIGRIVFPEPDDELPGARLDIGAGGCNCPGAVFGSDCERQVRDFVDLTRRVLRSQPATRFLTVNTDADTDPDTPVIGSTLSLRQAIELANSNGGATTITFDSGLKDKTIRPRVPLPALTAPDIIICGCDEMNCDYLVRTEKKCDPFLTIDGSQTDTTKGEQHSDGILIRSDRAVVRGLRIINFAEAGVSIEPICNRGFSRIERNRFENNKKAGVRVLDSPADPDPDGAVRHNIGNTISMNDILGSETPIDLAGDGPTPNDPGDLDEGPNTLLNFPDNLSVVAATSGVSATASGVSFTGQVNGPTAAGATVEIFAITSFRPVPGGRVIDGVIFLKQTTTNADGAFTVTELPDSPTCGYTVTVTDVAGNTSELMLPCGGFPKAKVTNLDFGDVAVPNQTPQTGTFSIENTGCAPLKVSFASIRRDGFPQRRPGQLARSDDGEHFSIQSIIVGSGGQTITIQPGQKEIFTATFDPAIPRVFTGGKPPASLTLPDIVNSTITLAHNGCAGSDLTVSLIGHVNRKILLIDPDKPRNDPLVTLTRSGNELTAQYFIFDSNGDVETVEYEFHNSDGSKVPLDNCCASLTNVQAAYAPGRSFPVTQQFTNANQHKRVATITVTVCDKEKNCATASGQLGASTQTAHIQSIHLEPRSKLILSSLKLASGFAQSRARRQ